MLDLLMKRRSIRKYEDREIEKEALDKILQGALTSPSSKNRRPWELIVVDNKENLTKLGDSRGHASAPIKNAPLAIVIAADSQISEIWIEDSSIIATVIQLMAESLGIGSCWIQVRNRLTPQDESVEDYVKNVLNIPEKYNVECMISLGYPSEEKSPHNNEALPYAKIHYNKF
ncbi:nitroreductase family protein [Tissierella sp. MB52-C2]|uniref:nitroreductase family protein n=1 Tax=Tissierella sp. MB52-C2 TaxID=3070999 RepID=UPI00280B0DE3|nr:nitroreductase family protein [Tissierella sp. MB52-C2]WMM25362.1 nitroreductase family protein [Tissierella sp. MB52-C2]